MPHSKSLEVGAWPAGSDSGPLPIHALHAALPDRHALSLPHLAGVSGEAFLFVYDPAPAGDALRYLRPIDTLGRAALSAGFTGRWESAASVDDAHARIEQGLADGLPILTSHLAPERESYQVILGLTDGRALIQVGDVRAAAPIVDWNGPVTSTDGWLDRPLFTLEPSPPVPERRDDAVSALRAAIGLIQGGEIAYPKHSGAQAVAHVSLAGRKALFGLPALYALRDDIATMMDPGDPDMISRILGQVGHLAYLRRFGHDFLYEVCRLFDSRTENLLQGCAGLHEQTAGLAHELVTDFWDPALTHDPDPAHFDTRMNERCSFVYVWPGEQSDSTHSTPWGVVIVRDDPERRKRALDVVDLLIHNEKQLLGFLASADL